MSLQDVYDSIVREVPEALVAHVHDGQTGTASNVISIASPGDFNKGFTSGVPSFIIVDSCQRSANLAIDMLSKQAGRMNDAVILVLLVHHATKDFDHFIKKVVPAFMANGADDVILVQHSTKMSLLVEASLAKAGVKRTERSTLENRFQASMDQVNSLFWNIAHQVLPDFPQMQPELIENRDKRVDNMAFVQKLGEGQFSSVYKWEHCVSQSGGAVKVFPKENVPSADHALQMATEFAMLHRLKNHPCVVKLRTVLHGKQSIYLFMEMAGTRNLFQFIRAAKGSTGLSWPLGAGIISQIATGVAHCHKMKVAHCDLETKNIVISDSGCAKIVDFGQAVDLMECVAPLNGILGTMPFIAPEILWGCSDWNPSAADIWSFAVIILEILGGNGAFVRLLGWEDKDLMNVAGVTRRAIELRTFFAEEEGHGHLLHIYDLCRVPPPSHVMQMLGEMLAVIPEKRIVAESIVERSRRAWV